MGMFYPSPGAPTSPGGLWPGAFAGNIVAMRIPHHRLRALLWAANGFALALLLGFAHPNTVYAPGPAATAAQARAGARVPSKAQPAQSRGRKKKAKPRLEPFVGTLQEAKKASQEQNVPLIVHVILEGEPQNDDYRNQILPYADLIVASEKAIVLVANNGEHSQKKVIEEIEGRRVSTMVCSVYPEFANCAQHRQSWDSIYLAYHDKAGEMQCPQTMLLNPDGSQSWRHNDGNPPQVKAVLKKLQAAQKAAGPGLTRPELADIKRLVKEAARSTDGKLWAQAWRDWNGVLAITKVGTFADQARAAQPKLVEKMRAEISELAKGLVPGEAVKTYAALDALLVECATTPVEAELRKALKRAEKDKLIADEIRAWKLEREATGLLREAEDCFAAENKKCARKALRKLFGKKYSQTEAAARGREAFPEYVPAAG
jgi:hypothetical protein